METQILNIFIVDDNRLMVAGLKNFIEDKCGDSVVISTFYDIESCLENISYNTHIVIVNYFRKGKNGMNVLDAIKNQNPDIKIIDYIIEENRDWKKVQQRIYRIIAEPIKIKVWELGLLKFVAIFLLNIFAISAIIFWVLYLYQR